MSQLFEVEEMCGNEAIESQDDLSAIEALIWQCSLRVTGTLSDRLRARVREAAGEFERMLLDAPFTPYRIFTFHLPLPRECAKIRYVDCVHDHHDFDYNAILRHFVTSATRTNPLAQIVVVTGATSVLPDLGPQVVVVRLPMDPHRVMFERSLAMSSLIASDAHDRPVAFFDSDAIPNRSLDHVFAQNFDVALTERPSENFYMPINEGVIYAKADDCLHAQRFFTTVLATYEKLILEQCVLDYYGDIERWRGGQLSLNAVAEHYRNFGSGRGGAEVLRLPCEEYNFWVEPHLITASGTWEGKSTLHLKGDSKYSFAQFCRVHNELFARRDSCRNS